MLQQFSLFYAGRIAEHFGAFVQWTYDGVAHHSAIDNADIRFADRFKREGVDLIYGLTLNNNPTVSDIYNMTPAWGFPFASDKPNGDKRCSNCLNFIPSSSCSIVEGSIGPNGYCMAWAKAKE